MIRAICDGRSCFRTQSGTWAVTVEQLYEQTQHFNLAQYEKTRADFRLALEHIGIVTGIGSESLRLSYKTTLDS